MHKFYLLNIIQEILLDPEGFRKDDSEGSQFNESNRNQENKRKADNEDGNDSTNVYLGESGLT